jgi:hypothetical protein
MTATAGARWRAPRVQYGLLNECRSRSTSRWTRTRAGDPVPGCAADVFLLHYEQQPFQTPNARPARSRRRGLRARERARNRTLRAAPSHTACCCRPPAERRTRGERCARSNTLRVFARIAERLAPAVRGAPGKNAATSRHGLARAWRIDLAPSLPRVAAEMFDRDVARVPTLARSALVDFVLHRARRRGMYEAIAAV